MFFRKVKFTKQLSAEIRDKLSEQQSRALPSKSYQFINRNESKAEHSPRMYFKAD